MKERLIMISDLWGKDKADWLINYSVILETKFDTVFYDSRERGNRKILLNILQREAV